jgi:hypothetical protein
LRCGFEILDGDTGNGIEDWHGEVLRTGCAWTLAAVSDAVCRTKSHLMPR